MNAEEKPLSEELMDLDPETRNLDWMVHRAREMEKELEELRRSNSTVLSLERRPDAPTQVGPRERAAGVLSAWADSEGGLSAIARDYDGDLSGAAEALEAEGCLMPTLPEPVWRPHAAHPHRYHVWEVPVIGRVEVGTSSRSLVSIYDDDEEVATFTRDQARQAGLALVAAADQPPE